MFASTMHSTLLLEGQQLTRFPEINTTSDARANVVLCISKSKAECMHTHPSGGAAYS